jgi:hypothetical protein
MFRQCSPGFLLVAALLPATPAAASELNLEAKAPYGDPVARQEQVTGWLTDTSQLRDSRDSQLRSVTVG